MMGEEFRMGRKRVPTPLTLQLAWKFPWPGAAPPRQVECSLFVINKHMTQSWFFTDQLNFIGFRETLFPENQLMVTGTAGNRGAYTD